jgi:hypothetical protein
METDFYAAMLVPPYHPSPEWAESLAENLLLPSFPISMWEAFGRRLRRNYLWIYLILGISWLGKTYLFPQPTLDWAEFIQRGAVGPLPGQLMLTLGAIYYGFLFLIAIGTITMTQATGEILPRFGEDHEPGMRHAKASVSGMAEVAHSWLGSRKRRRQFLALIITCKAEAVSNRILFDLGRGVTAIDAKGMYTGTDRTILMCALTVTEVHNLKNAVAKEDPQAFVVVSPAQEVLGRGFSSLEEG